MKPSVYLYRIEGGRWRVDVRHASLPAGRKRLTYDSKVRAQGLLRACEAWLYRGEQSPFAEPEEPRRRPKVKELLAWYADVHVAKAESAKARAEMEGRRAVLERYALAEREAEGLSVFDLLDYRRERLAAEKRAPKSVRPDMVHLRAALRAAKKKKKIEAHVFEALDKAEKEQLFGSWKPTPENSAGKPIPAEAWQAILAKFPEEELARALLFMRATGCRLDQAASLDWASFREMPLPGFALKRQKKVERFVALSVVREIVGPRQRSGLVFDEQGGGLYRRLQNAWRYRVPEFRLHDIRHTVGTELREAEGVENGASALGVSALMMGIYGEHQKDARNAAALERLGNRRATLPSGRASKHGGK